MENKPQLEPQAFPLYTDDGLVLGMTLRDYFAAKAMQSIIMEGWDGVSHNACKQSYEWADGMLAAREGK